MHNAPTEAKLLSYISWCKPILEYVDVVWDPHATTNIDKVEMIQNRERRFINNLKERIDSVSAAREQLCLNSLEKKTKNHRFCLLTKVLENEDEHDALDATYDEINQNKQHTITTRGEINFISPNNEIYYQSFLSHAIIDMRGPDTTCSNSQQ